LVIPITSHLWTFVSGWVTAPFVLVPLDGVFGRFDLAALRGCHTLNVCLFVCQNEEGTVLVYGLGSTGVKR
jgi:hypothetical protein